MNTGINAQLRRWYSQFSKRHEELREDLIDKLPEESVVIPRTANCDELEAYYSQFAKDHDQLRELMLETLRERSTPVAVTTRRDWLVKTAPRLAASTVAVAAGGSFLVSSMSKPVYAIEDVVHQVQEAPKMHLRGTRMEGRLPFEVFIERPNRFWITFQQVVLGEDRKFIGLTTGHRASDGKIRYLQEDTKDGYFPLYEPPFVQEDLPIWARIECESLVKEILGEEVLFEDAAGFAFVKRKSLKGKTVDVFERPRSTRTIQRLYVDPKTHLPVQAECVYRPRRGGKEAFMWCMDEIDLDPSGPPDHIQFKQFDPEDVSPLSSPIQRFSRATVRPLVAPFQLRIGQSCLTCWAKDDDKVAGEPIMRIVDRNNELVSCQMEDLGRTFDGETNWHWHLIHLPPRLDTPKVEIEYDEFVENRSTRQKKLKRSTPIEIRPAEAIEVLSRMATRSEAARILSHVRVAGPQA